MTNRPRLVPLGGRLAPGLLAVALFGVLAAVTLSTGFESGFVGFPDGVSVTAAIGYAMFDFGTLQSERGVPGTEPFLAAFLLIAIVLDAALDASLVLAKREEAGEIPHPASYDRPVAGGVGTTATAADGGRDAASDGGSTGSDTDGEPSTDGGSPETAAAGSSGADTDADSSGADTDAGSSGADTDADSSGADVGDGSADDGGERA